MKLVSKKEAKERINELKPKGSQLFGYYNDFAQRTYYLEYQQMVDFLQDLGFSADDAELTICALILIGGKFKR